MFVVRFFQNLTSSNSLRTVAVGAMRVAGCRSECRSEGKIIISSGRLPVDDDVS